MDEVNWYVLKGGNAFSIAIEQNGDFWFQTFWKSSQSPVRRGGCDYLHQVWGHAMERVEEIDAETFVERSGPLAEYDTIIQ